MRRFYPVLICLALFGALPAALALAAPKPAPAEAMNNLAVLRETVDFAHAPRANSFVDFSRSAFDGDVEQVLVNGAENRYHRNGVTLSMRPQ